MIAFTLAMMVWSQPYDYADLPTEIAADVIMYAIDDETYENTFGSD
jgi:hypothetical protein